jgi:hypothetical protein
MDPTTKTAPLSGEAHTSAPAPTKDQISPQEFYRELVKRADVRELMKRLAKR